VTDSDPKPARRRGAPSRSDATILGQLLALHAAPGRVLDASWGDGAIWGRALLDRYQPIRFDSRVEVEPDILGDWNHLADAFALPSIATIVWDPPHITNAGDGLAGGAKWADRYGTHGAGLRGNNVCGLFAPFLASARQVLDEHGGTVICKMADQVHRGELQWQPFELRRVALELGWLACDYQVRVRAQPLDPKWKKQRHVRRGATFWLVFHTGARCPNPGLDLVRICAGAANGHLFRPRLRDQLTCSDRRRRALSRRREEMPDGRHNSDQMV
jgi:hypothetical protein